MELDSPEVSGFQGHLIYPCLIHVKIDGHFITDLGFPATRHFIYECTGYFVVSAFDRAPNPEL